MPIVNNAYACYLAGPTQATLTASWQRLKITGTLASGRTGLWVAVRNFTGNGEEWTNDTVICLWGACLQEGSDPKRAYVRTWDWQALRNRAGAALGATAITAVSDSEPPLTIYGPGQRTATQTLKDTELNHSAKRTKGLCSEEVEHRSWTLIQRQKGQTLGEIRCYRHMVRPASPKLSQRADQCLWAGARF